MRRAIRSFIEEARIVLAGNAGVMALSWFLFSISSSLVNPYFAIYAKELGASDLDLANARALSMLALALSLIPGGILTDYIGRVKTILVGTFLIVIVQFLYAIAPDWRFLAIVWIADSAAHFYQPALTAIVMDSLPRERTFHGFLLLNVIPGIPSLFMPVVGGVLYERVGILGIRMGFVLSGIISAVVLALRAKMFKETFSPRDRDLSKFVLELAGYRPILFKALKVYLFGAFLWQITFSVLNTYGSIYATEVLRMSKTEWGIVSSISAIGGTIWAITLFTYKINMSRSLALAAYIIGVFAMLSYAFPKLFNISALLILSLASIAMNISSNIVNATISTMLTKLLPVEIRGRATSIQRILENLGASISSLFAGLAYVYLGPINSIILCFLIGLTTTIYLYFILSVSELSAKPP